MLTSSCSLGATYSTLENSADDPPTIPSRANLYEVVIARASRVQGRNIRIGRVGLIDSRQLRKGQLSGAHRLSQASQASLDLSHAWLSKKRGEPETVIGCDRRAWLTNGRPFRLASGVGLGRWSLPCVLPRAMALQ
jgi:hypothetical protein